MAHTKELPHDGVEATALSLHGMSRIPRLSPKRQPNAAATPAGSGITAAPSVSVQGTAAPTRGVRGNGNVQGKHRHDDGSERVSARMNRGQFSKSASMLARPTQDRVVRKDAASVAVRAQGGGGVTSRKSHARTTVDGGAARGDKPRSVVPRSAPSSRSSGVDGASLVRKPTREGSSRDRDRDRAGNGGSEMRVAPSFPLRSGPQPLRVGGGDNRADDESGAEAVPPSAPFGIDTTGCQYTVVARARDRLGWCATDGITPSTVIVWRDECLRPGDLRVMRETGVRYVPCPLHTHVVAI